MQSVPLAPLSRRCRKSPTRVVSILLAAVCVGTVLTVAEPAHAGADMVTIHEEPGVAVTIPDPRRTTKDLSTGYDKGRPGGVVPLACGTSCYLFPSETKTITPPGGGTSNIRTRGETNWVPYRIPVTNAVTKIDFYNTVSSSAWFGENPFNATSVTHQDVWDVDFAGLGFGWEGGPAGSASLGNGRVGFQNTVSNTWQVAHNVSHIRLSVAGSIWWLGYESHGSFQFGSLFFTADGYSSAFPSAS